jgi:hypothetical protein
MDQRLHHRHVGVVGRARREALDGDRHLAFLHHRPRDAHLHLRVPVVAEVVGHRMDGLLELGEAQLAVEPGRHRLLEAVFRDPHVALHPKALHRQPQARQGGAGLGQAGADLRLAERAGQRQAPRRGALAGPRLACGDDADVGRRRRRLRADHGHDEQQ